MNVIVVVRRSRPLKVVGWLIVLLLLVLGVLVVLLLLVVVVEVVVRMLILLLRPMGQVLVVMRLMVQVRMGGYCVGQGHWTLHRLVACHRLSAAIAVTTYWMAICLLRLTMTAVRLYF